MMRLKLSLLIFALACLLGAQTSGVMNGSNNQASYGISRWYKYSLVKIANGVNGCASANGCWQVNGVLGAAVAAALTQNVSLFNLPANGYVSDIRIKTVTACTGTTTALSGLGLTTSNNYYKAINYNIQTAAGDTNMVNDITATGSNRATLQTVVASLVSTVQNLDQLVDGCAVNYWLEWAVLP